MFFKEFSFILVRDNQFIEGRDYKTGRYNFLLTNQALLDLQKTNGVSAIQRAVFLFSLF